MMVHVHLVFTGKFWGQWGDLIIPLSEWMIPPHPGKIAIGGRNVQIFPVGMSLEWLLASVAAGVKGEGRNTQSNCICPILINFPSPCQFIHFCFRPSIYSWQLEVSIAYRESKCQKYLNEELLPRLCRFLPTPHSMHIMTESIQKCTLGKKKSLHLLLNYFYSHSATCKCCSSICESTQATSVYHGWNGDFSSSPEDLNGIMERAEKRALKNC